MSETVMLIISIGICPEKRDNETGLKYSQPQSASLLMRVWVYVVGSQTKWNKKLLKSVVYAIKERGFDEKNIPPFVLRLPNQYTLTPSFSVALVLRRRASV